MKIKSLFLTIIFTIIITTAFAQTNEEKYQTADDMIENYQYAEAISLLNELIESEPENYLYVKDLAHCYLSQLDFETAVKYFEQSIELNHDCVKCYSHLARAWYELGQMNRAITIIEQALKLSNTTAQVYMTRGLIYQAMQENEKAMLDFTKAIQLDKTSTDYLIARANFYIQTNQSHFAYSDLSDAIELDPENAEYYYYRAYILHNLKLLDEALIDIDKSISLDNSTADYYNLKFSIHFSRQEFEDAEQSIMKSLEIFPDSFMAYINLADMYFQSGRMSEYCTANQKALDLIPEGNEQQASAIRKTTEKYCDENRMPYYFVRSLTVYNQGDYNKTIEIINDGLEKIGNSSVLENLLATSYMSLQDYDKSLEFFTKSFANKEMLKSEVIDFYSVDLNEADIEFVANSYIVKSDFGLAMLHLINHELEPAITRLNTAEKMAISMEDFEGKEYIYNVKGYAHIVEGNYEMALTQFDIAIKQNPYYQQSYLNKALLLLFKASKFKNSKLEFEFSDYFKSLRAEIPKLKLKKGHEESLNEALEICNTVIKNEPKCAYAYLIKAKVSEFLGDENYKQYAEQAVTLGIENTFDELNIK